MGANSSDIMIMNMIITSLPAFEFRNAFGDGKNGGVSDRLGDLDARLDKLRHILDGIAK